MKGPCSPPLNPEHDYYVCFDQLDLGFSIEDPKLRAAIDRPDPRGGNDLLA